MCMARGGGHFETGRSRGKGKRRTPESPSIQNPH